MVNLYGSVNNGSVSYGQILTVIFRINYGHNCDEKSFMESARDHHSSMGKISLAVYSECTSWVGLYWLVTLCKNNKLLPVY